MVPLSEVRRRIFKSEMPEIIEGLKMRLEKLYQERKDPAKAEIGFRVMYRLAMGIKGRPKYPEFSWPALRVLLDAYVPTYE